MTAATTAAQQATNATAATMTPWRCGSPGCVVKPLLGMIDAGGRVHLRSAGRTRHPRYYVAGVGGVLAHCPSCHGWRWLITGAASDGAWQGWVPDGGCGGCGARTNRV